MKIDRTVYSKITLTAAALGVLLTASTNIYATPIPVVVGNGGAVLDIANQLGTLVGVTSAPNCINWAGGSTCPATTSEPDSVSGNDATVFAVGPGTIKNLPASFPTPLVDFETAPGGTLFPAQTVHFDLIDIQTPASNIPICVSSPICSTGTFVFTQNAPSLVTIAFTADLEAYVGTSGVSYNSATPYSAIFTTQLSGNLNGFGCVGTSNCTDTIANILAFEQGGGTITSTWSATESPVSGTPEPLSFILFGSGMLGLASLGRLRRRKA